MPFLKKKGVGGGRIFKTISSNPFAVYFYDIVLLTLLKRWSLGGGHRSGRYPGAPLGLAERQITTALVTFVPRPRLGQHSSQRPASLLQVPQISLRGGQGGIGTRVSLPSSCHAGSPAGLAGTVPLLFSGGTAAHSAAHTAPSPPGPPGKKRGGLPNFVSFPFERGHPTPPPSRGVGLGRAAGTTPSPSPTPTARRAAGTSPPAGGAAPPQPGLPGLVSLTPPPPSPRDGGGEGGSRPPPTGRPAGRHGGLRAARWRRHPSRPRAQRLLRRHPPHTPPSPLLRRPPRRVREAEGGSRRGRSAVPHTRAGGAGEAPSRSGSHLRG